MDMVNHPSHYKKEGRPESIEMLDVLCRPYKGPAAFCIGQLKYLYRAGTKAEEGLTQKQKMVEDIKKCQWYFKHLAEASHEWPDILEPDLSYRTLGDLSVDLMADTFSEDKPEEVKGLVADIIRNVYAMDSRSYLMTVLDKLDQMISILENS